MNIGGSRQQMGLNDGFAQFVCRRYFRPALDIPYGHDAAAENFTKIFPLQMDHQMVVVAGRVIKIMSFRSHQEGRRPAMPSEKVFAAFLQGEQAAPQLRKTDGASQKTPAEKIRDSAACGLQDRRLVRPLLRQDGHGHIHRLGRGGLYLYVHGDFTLLLEFRFLDFQLGV